MESSFALCSKVKGRNKDVRYGKTTTIGEGNLSPRQGVTQMPSSFGVQDKMSVSLQSKKSHVLWHSPDLLYVMSLRISSTFLFPPY